MNGIFSMTSKPSLLALILDELGSKRESRKPALSQIEVSKDSGRVFQQPALDVPAFLIDYPLY
jgi:hypothetical protein